METYMLLKKGRRFGFSRYQKFNDALLAKQAWRILKTLDCLLTTILRSRYFPSGDIHYASIRKQPSLGWRSILHGRDLLVCGLRFKVGDWRLINSYVDQWISSHSPRTTSQHSSSPTMCLWNLFQQTCNQWDDNALRQYMSLMQLVLGKFIYFNIVVKIRLYCIIWKMEIIRRSQVIY